MNELQPTEQRFLAVYRHAPTKKGEGRGKGSHLSAEGIALARRIGADLEPFDRVYASPYPRTMETAIAMGFAVDDIIEHASGYVAGEFEHHDQWDWDEPYVRFAEMLRSGGTVAQNAASDVVLWTKLLVDVPPGGRILIISHGGSIEPNLVACLPDADHSTWGAPFSNCDGAHLTYSASAGRFTAIDFYRSSRYQPLHNSPPK